MRHMVRNTTLVLVALGVLGLSGCSTTTKTAKVVKKLEPIVNPSLRGEDYPIILVMMPHTKDTHEVFIALKDELSSDFDLVYQDAKAATEKEIGGWISRYKPQAIVLMDNRTVRSYVKYQKSKPANFRFPPAVVVMTAFLDQVISSVKNACGIGYEVPGVITFVKLRELTFNPVKKVGVLHRKQFASFLANESKLAKIEKVELVLQETSVSPSHKEVTAGLKKLLSSGIDALWVLNDNALLRPDIIQASWLPTLKRNKLPVIVGVKSLVKKNIALGSFAILPDHSALGVQAAGRLFDLADEDWELEEDGDGRQVDLPLSIKTTVYLEMALKHFGLKEDKLELIDQIIQ